MCCGAGVVRSAWWTGRAEDTLAPSGRLAARERRCPPWWLKAVESCNNCCYDGRHEVNIRRGSWTPMSKVSKLASPPPPYFRHPRLRRVTCRSKSASRTVAVERSCGQDVRARSQARVCSEWNRQRFVFDFVPAHCGLRSSAKSEPFASTLPALALCEVQTGTDHPSVPVVQNAA